MTLVTRWNPYRELNRVNRLFNAQFAGGEESLTAGAFVPPVDVYEDEQGVQLKLEVPGVDEKDLDIRVENNTLTVSGERKFDKEEKEENFHRVERRYGSFTRSFTVPTTLSTEDIKADYEQGVLKIRLAKRAEAKPRQIKVNIGGQKPVEGQKVEAQGQAKGQAA
jgi:HSP20 family protein